MNDTDSILIVDDDLRILRLIENYLRCEGYSTHTATCAVEARQRLLASPTALIILDVGLPDEDGFSLAREIRTKSTVPIIMLTGKTDTVDKVVGLELGADDYMTKPFEARELLARVRSLLRRSQTPSPSSLEKSGIAHFGGWRIDLIQHELFSPIGKNVHLTSHEFRLLEAFIRAPNRVLTRDLLMDQIAGHDWSPLDRSIDVLIAKLRKKIELNPAQPSLIKAIRGEGYKLTTEVRFA
ncbi:MAG: response regulator transcription factor [Candidatus Contendobacter sp.]|jgi:DNA-binding response OmpR family regulator|nr:response regulator transcription factor [Candidatus Contendobacter sp.]